MIGGPFPALLGTEPLPTPDDYDAYWAEALDLAGRHSVAPRAVRVETLLTTVDVYDFSFAGSGGRTVTGWLRLPRRRDGMLPAVVHANGYGAGRLSPLDDLTWSAAGYAHLIVNTHGQRGGSTGHLLDGIEHPEHYYYRHVLVDVARAVDAMRELDGVDPSHVAMIGNSQGGGIALGVGALARGLVAVLAQAPFLTDAPTALQRAAQGPWTELRGYLSENPERADTVARTLAYVDGVTSARHATAPGWISDGLADDICPPETARSAVAAYSAPVRFCEWPAAGHEAGGSEDAAAALRALRERFTLG